MISPYMQLILVEATSQLTYSTAQGHHFLTRWSSTASYFAVHYYSRTKLIRYHDLMEHIALEDDSIYTSIDPL